jgi:hypothetical protein
MIGEDSSEKSDENTVCMLDRLVDCLDEDSLVAFQRFEYKRENDSVYIPSIDEEYSSTALMAMLLGRIRRNVILTAERLGCTNAEMVFVFAVPPNYSMEARQALSDAAYAASVSSSMCVDSTLAYGRVLQQRKFGDGEQKLMVVEIGHTRTSISLLKIGDNSAVNDDEKKESSDEGVTVLANVNSSIMGAGNIDVCLYNHFLSTHPLLVGSSFHNKSRSAQRLLDGCKKLKHLLSMLPEGKVTVESIGDNESDVNLSANRTDLVQLCEESVTEQLKAMLEQCIEEAGGRQILDDLASVELTGGGSRIPLVQDTILECLGKQDKDFVFSKSLDDTSLALGAAMMGPRTLVSADDSLMQFSVERQEQRKTLQTNEMAMADKDREISAKDGLKNQIESLILELRSARHSKHGSLLPTSEDFTTLLDGTDDWLFSDECNEATLEAMSKKWTEVKSKSECLCADYFNAKTQEAERIEREMEEEAKRAAAERDSEAMLDGHDGEGDHDNRKLPTKRRMEIVVKNKDEGTELFAGGNYKFAAARYSKALTHCSKFFDLSAEDEEEVGCVFHYCLRVVQTLLHSLCGI